MQYAGVLRALRKWMSAKLAPYCLKKIDTKLHRNGSRPSGSSHKGKLLKQNRTGMKWRWSGYKASGKNELSLKGSISDFRNPIVALQSTVIPDPAFSSFSTGSL